MPDLEAMKLADRLTLALQGVPARKPNARHARFLVDERDIAEAAALLRRNSPTVEEIAAIVDPDVWSNLSMRKRMGYDTERDTRRSLKQAQAIASLYERTGE